MKHVVMFSGGAGSWAAAKRVVFEHGTEDVTLLFSDTKTEDEDLYRFVAEAAVNVGVPLITVADGRNVWEVFHDDRFIGNSRLANCSKFLKQAPAHAWLKVNADPHDTTIYVGIDWTEEHRLAAVTKAYAPAEVRAPLCEEPLIDKVEVLDWLADEGLAPPRLYGLGFAHNNCGGFCVRAGQKQFRRLLDTFPVRYAYHEQQEAAMREYLDKDVAILRDRTGGTVKPLTLRDFRLRDEDDGGEGGCGCFVSDDVQAWK